MLQTKVDRLKAGGGLGTEECCVDLKPAQRVLEDRAAGSGSIGRGRLPVPRLACCHQSTATL